MIAALAVEVAVHVQRGFTAAARRLRRRHVTVYGGCCVAGAARGIRHVECDRAIDRWTVELARVQEPSFPSKRAAIVRVDKHGFTS